MEYHPTTWPIFLGLIAIYTVMSLYMLGAKKVFFEPYNEANAESKSADG